jgi:AraC-like DNA-binding protein
MAAARVSASGRRCWFDDLVWRCQALAALAIDGPRDDVGRSIRRLTVDMPHTLPLRERLAAREVLSRALARSVRIAGIDRRPDVAAVFVQWAASDISVEVWPDDVRRFVTACASALEYDPPEIRRVIDPRTDRLLRIIEERFRDPKLTLREVAAGSRVSLWHAARLLKCETGSPFGAHLHRTRVVAATDLLRDVSCRSRRLPHWSVTAVRVNSVDISDDSAAQHRAPFARAQSRRLARMTKIDDQ